MPRGRGATGLIQRWRRLAPFARGATLCCRSALSVRPREATAGTANAEVQADIVDAADADVEPVVEVAVAETMVAEAFQIGDERVAREVAARHAAEERAVSEAAARQASELRAPAAAVDASTSTVDLTSMVDASTVARCSNSSDKNGRIGKKAADADARDGTVRCRRSLHGPRHRPSGTWLSSGIMPASPVAAPTNHPRDRAP